MSDEIASMTGGGNLANLNAGKQAAFANNPAAAFTGQAVGAIGTTLGIGAVGKAVGLGSRLVNPQLMGDLAFGTASGIGQSNDNRLLGGVLGAAGGYGGNLIGNAAAMLTRLPRPVCCSRCRRYSVLGVNMAGSGSASTGSGARRTKATPPLTSRCQGVC